MQRRQRDKQRAVTRRLTFLILTAILTVSTSIAPAAEDTYGQAVDAFKRGAYEEALEGFLQARSEGMDSPALAYNLGTTYYRLERYDRAREAFLAAADSPDYADLAHYNLGLVAIRQDNDEEARRWLLHVTDSDNEKLRTLAHTAMRRIGRPRARGGAGAWSGFATGDIGYDSNVLLRSDTETLSTSERDDFFLDFFGYAFRPLGGDRDLSLDASAYLLEHMDLSEFDIGSLRFGGTMGESGRRWRHTGGAHLAFVFLDGDEFTRETLLEWAALRALRGNRRLRLRYEAARIDAMDSSYDYLDGWRHSLDARLGWRPERQRYYLLYELEVNDREDRRTPLTFTSLSPVRQTLRAVGQRSLHEDLVARAELRFRHSRYRDAHEFSDGSSEVRIDRRLRFIGKLSRVLADGKEIALEYRYTDNDSNIPVYQYTRYRIMLGAFFPF